MKEYSWSCVLCGNDNESIAESCQFFCSVRELSDVADLKGTMRKLRMIWGNPDLEREK